jgi:translation initiation factor 2 subunit 1
LKEGFGASKEDCEVSIKLIAHPLFALTCMCREKELGINVLDDAMTRIENAIKAAGGTFALKSKPSTLQQKEDGEEKDDDDDDDSSGSSSSEDAEDQDDTMGNLDADFTDIMKKKVDDDDSD